ncbi:MAG: hypothetical protein WC998_01385 [Candidatus Paceibacterota bacterium]|jgi:hypothetical protein
MIRFDITVALIIGFIIGYTLAAAIGISVANRLYCVIQSYKQTIFDIVVAISNSDESNFKNWANEIRKAMIEK